MNAAKQRNRVVTSAAASRDVAGRPVRRACRPSVLSPAEHRDTVAHCRTLAQPLYAKRTREHPAGMPDRDPIRFFLDAFPLDAQMDDTCGGCGLNMDHETPRYFASAEYLADRERLTADLADAVLGMDGAGVLQVIEEAVGLDGPAMLNDVVEETARRVAGDQVPAEPVLRFMVRIAVVLAGGDPVTGRPVLVGRFEANTPAWDAARLVGLGGSEISAVLRLSPFESRFSLWHRKRGLVPSKDLSEVMEWGHRLEPVVRSKFLEQHPEFALRRPGGTYHAAGRSWQIANPDGILVPATNRRRRPVGILEIKTSAFPDEWGTSGTDEIPVFYRTQLLWYLDVFGLQTGHVAVLIGGREYREYTVAYDVAEATQLRDAGRAFLEDVAAGIRPDIDADAHTYQTIRDLHPDIDGTTVELPAGVGQGWVTAHHDLQRATDAERLAKARVLDAMGDARLATVHDLPVARRQPHGHAVSLYFVAEKPAAHPTTGAAA